MDFFFIHIKNLHERKLIDKNLAILFCQMSENSREIDKQLKERRKKIME